MENIANFEKFKQKKQDINTKKILFLLTENNLHTIVPQLSKCLKFEAV